MTSPHKKIENHTNQDPLHILNSLMDKKWSKSKNKILFKSVFLARISKILFNFCGKDPIPLFFHDYIDIL